MTQQQSSLERLESLLESFLERAVALKGDRLRVLDGINRLDDIARLADDRNVLPDRVGDWLARHNTWLTESSLRPADYNRIGKILEAIKAQLAESDDVSAEAVKLQSEISRWNESAGATRDKIVLRRPPEVAPSEAGSEGRTAESEEPESIARVRTSLKQISALFADLSGPRDHVLSVLDSTLRSADLQKNKEALLLSAYIIYCLKLDGYKVEPYVRRLKDAERLIKEDKSRA